MFQLGNEQDERRSSLTNQSFLPSNLFALGQHLGGGGGQQLGQHLGGGGGQQLGHHLGGGGGQQLGLHLGQYKGGGGGGADGVQQQEEKSEWFQLFADLDPLANPDSVGRKDGWDGGC